MSLLSLFHAGAAAEIARALREDRPGADAAVASLDLSVGIRDASGLFADQIDAACRELGRMRGGPPLGLREHVVEVIDGDGEEAQCVRLAPTFVRSFAALTEPEITELSGLLAGREAEEDREFRERMLRLASRPIQSKLDLLALLLAPLLAGAWARKAGAGSTRSVLVAAAVGGAFLALTFLVLPWLRRRRVPPLARERREHAPALAALAALCRRAEREGLDLVYEWSV